MSITDPSYPILSEHALLIFNDQVYPLVQEITTIGRSLDNDVVIQNEAVSRHHAKILYEESQFVIYDLGSTGGLFVNAQQTEREVLFSGDNIHLSTEEMLFMLKGASIDITSDQKTQFLPRKQSGPDEDQDTKDSPQSDMPKPAVSNPLEVFAPDLGAATPKIQTPQVPAEKVESVQEAPAPPQTNAQDQEEPVPQIQTPQVPAEKVESVQEAPAPPQTNPPDQEEPVPEIQTWHFPPKANASDQDELTPSQEDEPDPDESDPPAQIWYFPPKASQTDSDDPSPPEKNE